MNIANIKNKLGFCCCDGCKKRVVVTLKINESTSKVIKRGVCKKHYLELINILEETKEIEQ